MLWPVLGSDPCVGPSSYLEEFGNLCVIEASSRAPECAWNVHSVEDQDIGWLFLDRDVGYDRPSQKNKYGADCNRSPCCSGDQSACSGSFVPGLA